MVLRLSPAHPLVWLSPNRLQVGFDAPVAVLDRAPERVELLIGALERGLSETGPAPLAARFGLPEREVVRVLRTLGPALQPQAEPLEGVRVTVCADDADVADALIAQASALGAAPVERGCGDLPDAVDLAVAVFRFAVQPRRCAPFAARDTPVLPVVFGESSIHVGPVLEPDGPCAACLHLWAVEADSEWEVKAIQASARRAPTMSARGIAAASAEVAGALLRWAEGAGAAESGSGRARIRLGADSTPGGGAVVEVVRPHPECACASPRGSATETARPSASSPAAPRRSGGVVVPA